MSIKSLNRTCYSTLFRCPVILTSPKRAVTRWLTRHSAAKEMIGNLFRTLNRFEVLSRGVQSWPL